MSPIDQARGMNQDANYVSVSSDGDRDRSESDI